MPVEIQVLSVVASSSRYISKIVLKCLELLTSREVLTMNVRERYVFTITTKKHDLNSLNASSIYVKCLQTQITICILNKV